MTELNLLLEEFPDEANSTTLRTLREQLEKELALTTNLSNVHNGNNNDSNSGGAGTDGSGPQPATYPSPSDPRAKPGVATRGAAAYVAPPDAPCRSFRGALHNLENTTSVWLLCVP